MKKCPNCGQRYSDEDNFCYHDGAPLLIEFRERPDMTANVSRKSTEIVDRLGGVKLQYLMIGFLAIVFASIAMSVYDRFREAVPIAVGATAKTQKVLPTPESTITARASTIDLPVEKQAIRLRLEEWRSAGENRSSDQIAQSYASSVHYYARQNATRGFVMKDKSRAYARFSSISITLEIISITVAPDGQTSKVLIDKEWSFSGNGHSQGKVRQELRLTKSDNKWLINGERDVRVYYKTQ